MGGSRNLAGLRHGRGGSLIAAADKGWRVAVTDLTTRYSLSPSFIMDVSAVWERRMAAVRLMRASSWRASRRPPRP